MLEHKRFLNKKEVLTFLEPFCILNIFGKYVKSVFITYKTFNIQLTM